MALTNRRMSRFQTDRRSANVAPITIRRDFYREEFVKHQECLKQQREYYSDRVITDVEAALSRIITQLEQLCAKDDADQVVSRLLRRFDVVTRLSAWTDPKKIH